MTVRWLTAFIDRPEPTFDAAVRFWMRITGSSLSPARGEHGEFATLRPPDGDAYLRVQRIRDGLGGSHLDVHVDDDISRVADRTRELGASDLAGPDDIAVMVSPGGIVFCIVEHHDESVRSEPVAVDGAPRLRVDQLCLDLSPDSYEADCEFWPALTGWEHRPALLPGFSYLVRPSGIPLRLLLQRTDDVAHQASAHLDIACADVPAVVEVHQQFGATVHARHEYWTTMLDPAGVPYCLTTRHPDTGVRAL